jgi:uncharacterized protein (TIGR02147 family)
MFQTLWTAISFVWHAFSKSSGSYMQVRSKTLNPHAVETLRREFIRRKERNPNYSLRSFARLLKVSPGALSQWLASKRPITIKQATKISSRLGFDPAETNAFLQQLTVRKPGFDETSFQVSEDVFSIVADWYHFAILSLMETTDFVESPRWIASRLGISVVEVQQALERLERMRLTRRENGILRPSHANLTTTHDIPSAAVRKSHRQNLEHAQMALEEVAVELRDISLITMAIDSSKLPEAKERIRAFRRSMSEFLESGKRDQVYTLSIQLIPKTTYREPSA